MIAFRSAAGIAILLGLFSFLGLRSLKKSPRKEKLIYLFLLLWCAYIPVSVLFNWVPLTTASLRVVMYSPIGTWMENAIFKQSP
ncbi:MAG: hypothetical protein K0R57_2661 [Paenibacillaceae bacterium]|jgi:hypothetical protein|nr:hypothetical protein [Paenibacillaceae bacterium]